MMKRVLVTGGAGFLGRHLCEHLLGRNHEVLCVDNFFTGSKRNLLGLFDDPRFELMRHDVCFPLYVEVDQIFNLACPASPEHYQRDPTRRAEELLDWRPMIDLETGLLRTIAYFDDLLRRGDEPYADAPASGPLKMPA